MLTNTYTPAIVTKYNEAKRHVKFLENVHDADKKRMARVIKRDIQLSDELDALVNGFSYGGEK